MNPSVACPGCGCNAPDAAAAHEIVAALLAADLDQAIAAGLLDCEGCDRCGPACTRALLAARDGRVAAFAARERYRARNARLQRRAAELAVRRAPAPVVDTPTDVPVIPALPAAAAAALARAKARAAKRRQP